MSSGIGRSLGALFGSDLPRWACEFTPGAVVALGVSPDRKQVVSASSVRLPDDAVRPGLKLANLVDPAALGAALKRALEETGFDGSEMVVVIPDDAARISLLEAESFPSSVGEREAFIRWKFKKNVQFDIGSARLAYEKLGENGTVDLLTVLCPEGIVAEYERVVEDLGLHPGFVIPSTLAALRLLDAPAPAGDMLFVKPGRASIATAILKAGTLRFYRKVPQPVAIEEAVYPTLMYYQDKLAGSEPPSSIAEMTVCAERDVAEDDIQKAASRLGLDVRRLYSTEVEDIYKPALGALQS